jgi:PemK-like, MazF-like toxin of type II toxin-antitoxin system
VKDQFDVWRFVFPKQGEHSVVLISHPDRCARAEIVNVLYGTSQRQNRKPYPHEVMLDMADGFDWETFCDCTLMYSVASAALFGKRGRVTLERRRAIREKIRDVFLLMNTD